MFDKYCFANTMRIFSFNARKSSANEILVSLDRRPGNGGYFCVFVVRFLVIILSLEVQNVSLEPSASLL